MATTDIHTHMFNLKYLPVAGIIRRYSGEKVPLVIARGVEKYLIRKTKTSFGNEGYEILKELKTKFVPIANILNFEIKTIKVQEMILKRDFNLFDLSKVDIITNFSNQLNEMDLKDVQIAGALEEFRKIQTGNTNEIAQQVNFSTLSLVEDFSIDILQSGYDLFDKMFHWVIEQIEKAMEKIEEGVSFLRWFAFMLNSEEDIFARINEKDELGISSYLHLMMDVDYFFTEDDGTEHHSYFDFKEQQVPNMEALNKKHGDKLTGFVAFNPSRNNCMDIIKDSISQKGFTGVKFYPPLGYKADGDANPDFKNRITDLLNYCSDPKNDIPLFTHCNNAGFQAYPKSVPPSGYNANPIYWEQALIKYPKLRLCLAHGGGTEGWFTEVKDTDKIKANQIIAGDIKDDSELQILDWNNSYAAMVFKLCVTYDNVYCDAAYLDDMVKRSGGFDDDDVETKANNFKVRLLKLFLSEPKFSKKIMYGSDWHMLFKEGKNETYYSTYEEFFKDSAFDTYRNDFFQMNSNRYLKKQSLII